MALVWDGSASTPPTLVLYAYQPNTGQIVPDGTFTDHAALLHFTTNADINAFPAGVLWPPPPAPPVGDYVVLTPYSPSPIPVPAAAWNNLRYFTSVYAFGLYGPRTDVVIGVTYDMLVRPQMAELPRF